MPTVWKTALKGVLYAASEAIYAAVSEVCVRGEVSDAGVAVGWKMEGTGDGFDDS